MVHRKSKSEQFFTFERTGKIRKASLNMPSDINFIKIGSPSQTIIHIPKKILKLPSSNSIKS